MEATEGWRRTVISAVSFSSSTAVTRIPALPSACGRKTASKIVSTWCPEPWPSTISPCDVAIPQE